MTLNELLDAIRPSTIGWTVLLPTNWMQGRTAYGGVSTAMAHHCARLMLPDVPPLRSAQIAFVGPLAGELQITCDLIRRGRNTAFVETRIAGEDGCGFLATFIFMNPRSSTISYDGPAKPDFSAPPADSDIRHGPPEFFTSNFDYPDKRLQLGANTNRLLNWHRLSHRGGIDPTTELLCVGDALPPSAMGLMDASGPISSMNWQVNLLTDTPSSSTGWWLLDSQTHHAGHGASSQYMTVWNSEGEAVMTGMQSVALFV